MENNSNIPQGEPSKPYVFAIKFGILTGIIYVLLLLLRYLFLASDPRLFAGSIILSYLVILGFFAYAGLARRKALGGYAETKEVFGTIFIVILIAEFFYLLFNFIYLNYIDPDFFQRYTSAAVNYLQESGADIAQVTGQIDKLEMQNEQKKTLGDNLRLFATSIVIDGIFGLVMSLVIRKSRPQY